MGSDPQLKGNKLSQGSCYEWNFYALSIVIFLCKQFLKKVTLKALAGSQNSFDMILRGLEQSSGVSPAL
jgi:hypothetical protein